jgi:hypothetical protein
VFRDSWLLEQILVNILYAIPAYPSLLFISLALLLYLQLPIYVSTSSISFPFSVLLWSFVWCIVITFVFAELIIIRLVDFEVMKMHVIEYGRYCLKGG